MAEAVIVMEIAPEHHTHSTGNVWKDPANIELVELETAQSNVISAVEQGVVLCSSYVIAKF